ncbi:MAG: alanine racemase [Armatimonadota bacterium]
MNATNWLEIDLGALQRNARRVQQLIGERCALWAVVKADAYGHGAVPIARALEQAGISRFCVASIPEGIELREAGITKPIMAFLPPLTDADWEAVINYGLEVVIEDEAGFQSALRAAARRNKPLFAHLEIDTGMSRLGWLPSQLPTLLQRWRPEHPIRWVSLFTHFACADSDLEATREQLRRFLDAVEMLYRAGFPRVPLHAAASAGLLSLPESHLDAVRCGLLLYGILPLPERSLLSRSVGEGLEVRASFEPVLSWRARVLSVRLIPEGQGVSYGWRFRAPRPMRVATLGVGYGDGYPIALSGHTQVLLQGKRVPQIGRICMDMLMVDVSELPAVQPGEVATLLGKEGNECIRVEELAHRLDTPPHELTTRLSKRPARQILPPAGEFFEGNSV